MIRLRRFASTFLKLSYPTNYNYNNFQTNIIRSLGTSPVRYDLMEFFDVKKNWGETNIRTGRSWKLDELRLKSNTDLHKLW